MSRSKIIVLIVVLSIVSIAFSTFLYILDLEDGKKEATESVSSSIDSRISPYLNQGLTVQIKRIRNRDLMDKMVQFGRSWQKKPTFYWIAIVDGKEHNLDAIEAAGGVKGSGAFTEWDTFGKETKGNFYINDEQKTSEIILIIMEKEEKGLFGRRTDHIEKERLSLTYDYRTGRWSGDDFFKDADGYGHYRGDEYELWFDLKQSDYDHDGIPFWMEVNILHTDPTIDDSKMDPDADGCPTSWEWRWGYDPHTWNDHVHLDPDIDGIENIEEYQMMKWFADPFQPDIYLEIDGMQKGGLFDWDHVSFEESHQMLIERFALHGMNMYIDYGWPDGPINGGGELLPFIDVLDDTIGHHHNRFYIHHFADERKGIFRYVTIVNNAGFIVTGEYNYYDHIVIDTSLKKTFINRLAVTPRYQRVVLAKGILHELGHSLGLTPSSFYGVDIFSDKENRWPTELSNEEFDRYLKEYHSIMNYYYIFSDRKLFDYSDGSNGAPYDQDDWTYFYLPTFQTDASIYEEAVPTIDKTFEDIEHIDKKPGVLLKGWWYDENLTTEYSSELSKFTFLGNAAAEYRIYKENVSDAECDIQNVSIRIYAKPKVEPVTVRWTLVAEGIYNNEYDLITFYSIDDLIQEII